MRFKVSKYTIYERTENGYDIFNSLTGAIIRLKDKEFIDSFEKIISSSDPIEYVDNNPLHSTCMKNGIFIPEDENELVNVVHMFENSFLCSRTLDIIPLE